MIPLSRHRGAQLALGVLLIVVIRSLGEFLRLYDPAVTHIGAELFLYLSGALAAAIAALLVLILHALGRDRSAIFVTVAAILGLLAYKIIVTM